MKELLKYIGKYKFHTIMAPLCILFEVAIETLIPTVMGKMLIDKAVSQGNMDLIIKYGLLLAGLTLLALFFGIVSGKFASVASTGFAKNLRADMYRKIQKFSFANIDKFSTSSLVTRMTTDVMNVRQAFQMILRITVRAPLQFITAVVASLIISPSLAKYFLYVIPFLIIGLGFIIYKAHPPGVNPQTTPPIAAMRRLQRRTRRLSLSFQTEWTRSSPASPVWSLCAT